MNSEFAMIAISVNQYITEPRWWCFEMAIETKPNLLPPPWNFGGPHRRLTKQKLSTSPGGVFLTDHLGEENHPNIAILAFVAPREKNSFGYPNVTKVLTLTTPPTCLMSTEMSILPSKDRHFFIYPVVFDYFANRQKSFVFGAFKSELFLSI